MKKYLFLMACVALLNGGLFAQTSSSDNNSTSSGTSSSSSGATVSEPSGASTSSKSTNAGEINEPSGAATISQTPGVITIRGTVSSSAEKQEIEKQLRQISGVTDVRNMLRVAPSGSSGASQPDTSSPSQPQSNP